MVNDYKSRGGWHDLVELSQDLAPLMSSLNATINQNNNTLIWGDTSDGVYSAATGYLSLVGRMKKPIWAKD